MSSDTGWYYADAGQPVGPMSRAELIARLPSLQGPDTLVYGPNTPEWTRARHVSSLMQHAGAAAPPPPSMRVADEIDYEIFGDDMQFVEVTLDPQEVVIAEAGAMLYMTQGIQMQTVFGDPSKNTGLLGKLFDAGKRMVTGESLFLTTFANAREPAHREPDRVGPGSMGVSPVSREPGRVGPDHREPDPREPHRVGPDHARRASMQEKVAFASPYPGKIVPLHLDQLGMEILCQKAAFLCAARGVQIGIAFQKKIGVGLFGGEGFILQRIQGDGIAFVHAGGTIVKRDLAPGEKLRVDTGCLVAFQPSVAYDIQLAGGIKTSLFGGEGLFLASLTGPGSVWLQSLPFSRLAGRIAGTFAKGKGEGSILGGLGNLFEQ